MHVSYKCNDDQLWTKGFKDKSEKLYQGFQSKKTVLLSKQIQVSSHGNVCFLCIQAKIREQHVR